MQVLINLFCFLQVPQDQLKEDLVGRPLMHLSAEKQVTGEAVYLDDMPPFAGYNLLIN